MDGRDGSLSLIIPAYNEADNIRQAIAEADQALAGMVRDYEIIVVDDGSRDHTAQVVGEAARTRGRVRLLRHDVNRGYGAALRTGFEAARFDRVAFTDADCQFDLRDLAPLVALTDQYPLAVGFRAGRRDNWRRRVLSRGYNLLIRGLLGTRVRDCDCALKVFRKAALARLLPESTGFFVNAEMLTRARQCGFPLAEVGVRHRPRYQGTSKVAPGDVPRTLAALLPFWWSRVLFPSGEDRRARIEERGSRIEDRKNGPPSSILYPRSSILDLRSSLGFCTLLLVALLLFFTRLRTPLLEPDEARYAEIPREMLAEGRFVLPVLHGQPYDHKPPLLYWLVMASYALFGVHDWAARLVPCAAALATVLVTYGWGRRTLGNRAAFAGAMMLCLSARFVYGGRMLTVDGLLGLSVVSAWAAAHVAVQRRGLAWRWWLLSAAACGLGLLTMGPVAWVLVAVPVLLYQLLDLRTARPRLGPWAVYLAITLVVAAPWYIAVGLQDGRFLGEFFWTHNLMRFVTPLDHQAPPWYYLPGLLLGMLPWTLLLPALLKFLGRRSATTAAHRPAALGLYLLAFLWCLGFFSAAGCKRPGYILPAMPPLALALGGYLDAVLPRVLRRRHGLLPASSLSRLAWRATLVTLAGGAAVCLAAVFAEIQKPLPGFLLAGGAVAALAYLVHRGPARRAEVAWGLCGTVTFAVLWTALNDLQPGYARKFSLRAQVRLPQSLALDRRVPVACYPHSWDSVSFYLRRDDIQVYTPSNRQHLWADLRKRASGMLVFVKSDDPQQRFLREFRRDLPPGLEFVPLNQHGLVTAGILQPRTEVPPFLLARLSHGETLATHP